MMSVLYGLGLMVNPKSKQEEAVLLKERATFERLVQLGFDVEVLARGVKIGMKYPDIRMNGRVWEVKGPEGSSRTTIDNNVKRAKRQSTHIVIDNSYSGLTDADAERGLVSSFLNRTKVIEIFMIRKDGSIVWLRREAVHRPCP